MALVTYDEAMSKLELQAAKMKEFLGIKPSIDPPNTTKLSIVAKVNGETIGKKNVWLNKLLNHIHDMSETNAKIIALKEERNVGAGPGKGDAMIAELQKQVQELKTYINCLEALATGVPTQGSGFGRRRY